MYAGLLLGRILVIVIVLQLGYTAQHCKGLRYPLLALSYKVTAGKPLLRRQVLWYVVCVEVRRTLIQRALPQTSTITAYLYFSLLNVCQQYTTTTTTTTQYYGLGLGLRLHYAYYNPCSIYLTQLLPRLLCFPLHYLLTQVHAVYCIHAMYIVYIHTMYTVYLLGSGLRLRLKVKA